MVRDMATNDDNGGTMATRIGTTMATNRVAGTHWATAAAAIVDRPTGTVTTDHKDTIMHDDDQADQPGDPVTTSHLQALTFDEAEALGLDGTARSGTLYWVITHGMRTVLVNLDDTLDADGDFAPI